MFFLCFLATICVVNSDFISENFIVEVLNSNVHKAHSNPFQVYWNVPTKQCRHQKNSIPFDGVLKKYGISYNKNDKFEGERITIIYDGGYIPDILKRNGTKYSIRNGGLPQEGNLELHLTSFRETVTRLIPDPNFNGVGVIDMESWRPIFRQHWSKLADIVNLSLSIEKRRFWWWPNSWIRMEATKRFEDAARVFMEKTLSTAKQMRPLAVWGYYGFPYCYNMMQDMEEHCSKTIKGENDRLYWLWAESTALYPSLYSPVKFSTSELEAFVRGRLAEANRIKQAEALVLPYFWIKYRDGAFFKEKDLIAVFETLQRKNASGLIIWGASSDVNCFEKCEKLHNYVNNILGPISKKYMWRINKIYDEKIKINTKNVDSSNSTTIDIGSTTHKTISNNNQVNISNNNLNTLEKWKNISFIQEHKQINEYFYETDKNKSILNNSNETEIWDIIEYSTESIKIIDPHFNLSKTNQTISNENTFLNNDDITEKKSLINDSCNINLCNSNKTENILRINNTSLTKLTTNNTRNIILNSIQSKENTTNPEEISTAIYTTEITTESELESSTFKQLLNKYYYETDDNKTEISSNESDIWNIEKYQSNLVQNGDKISVENIEYTENSESLNQKNSESYNTALTTEKTISIKTTPLVIYETTTDQSLSTIESLNVLENEIGTFENITDANAVTMNNSNKIVTVTDHTPWSTIKEITINESFDNTAESVLKENNVLDIIPTISTTILIKGNNFCSQNVCQEEQVPENTTYQKSYESDSRERHILDHSFTYVNNISKPLQIKDFTITQHLPDDNVELESQQQNIELEMGFIENTTSKNDEMPNFKEKHISEDIITAANLTSPTNMKEYFNATVENKTENNQILPLSNFELDSIDILQSKPVEKIFNFPNITNDTEKKFLVDSVILADKSASSLKILENGSTGIRKKVKDIPQKIVGQDDQLIKNTNNINGDIYIENVANDSVTLEVKDSLTSPTTIFVDDIESGVKGNMEGENNSEYLYNYTRDISQDEQLFKHTTYPNIEASVSSANDISDYLIIIEKYPISSSVNSTDTVVIENAKSESHHEFILPSQYNISQASQNLSKTPHKYTDETFVSRENDVLDYLITYTKKSSPINTLVKSNDVENIEEIYKDGD